jgi:uncharacterized membrane protein YhdT
LDMSRRGKKKRLWQLFFDPVAMKNTITAATNYSKNRNTPLHFLYFPFPFFFELKCIEISVLHLLIIHRLLFHLKSHAVARTTLLNLM